MVSLNLSGTPGIAQNQRIKPRKAMFLKRNGRIYPQNNGHFTRRLYPSAIEDGSCASAFFESLFGTVVSVVSAGHPAGWPLCDRCTGGLKQGGEQHLLKLTRLRQSPKTWWHRRELPD